MTYCHESICHIVFLSINLYNKKDNALTLLAYHYYLTRKRTLMRIIGTSLIVFIAQLSILFPSLFFRIINVLFYR